MISLHSSIEVKPRTKFADFGVGEYFTVDGTVYEKLSEDLARGPKRHILGTGVYDFAADDEVGEA